MNMKNLQKSIIKIMEISFWETHKKISDKVVEPLWEKATHHMAPVMYKTDFIKNQVYNRTWVIIGSPLFREIQRDEK